MLEIENKFSRGLKCTLIICVFATSIPSALSRYTVFLRGNFVRLGGMSERSSVMPMRGSLGILILFD